MTIRRTAAALIAVVLATIPAAAETCVEPIGQSYAENEFETVIRIRPGCETKVEDAAPLLPDNTLLRAAEITRASLGIAAAPVVAPAEAPQPAVEETASARLMPAEAVHRHCTGGYGFVQHGETVSTVVVKAPCAERVGKSDSLGRSPLPTIIALHDDDVRAIAGDSEFTPAFGGGPCPSFEACGIAHLERSISEE